MNQGKSGDAGTVIKLDQDNFLVTGDGQALFVYKVGGELYDDEWPEGNRELIKQWLPLPAPAKSADGKLRLGQRMRPASKTDRHYAQVTFGDSELPLYTFTGKAGNPMEHRWDRAHLEMGDSGDSSDDGGRASGGRLGP
jgi:hypothetical protein